MVVCRTTYSQIHSTSKVRHYGRRKGIRSQMTRKQENIADFLDVLGRYGHSNADKYIRLLQ